MSRTILVTGGAASGKSRWAISEFAACDNVLYICPSQLDEETKNRIAFNNNKNYVEWDIRENVTSDPKSLFNKHKFVVFDGIGEYTAAKIEEMCPDKSKLDSEMEKQIEKKVIDDVLALHEEIRLIEGDIVVITFETGYSMEPRDPFVKSKRKIIGMVNQRIANMSSDVYLSASGIQFKIK